MDFPVLCVPSESNAEMTWVNLILLWEICHWIKERSADGRWAGVGSSELEFKLLSGSEHFNLWLRRIIPTLKGCMWGLSMWKVDRSGKKTHECWSMGLSMRTWTEFVPTLVWKLYKSYVELVHCAFQVYYILLLLCIFILLILGSLILKL